MSYSTRQIFAGALLASSVAFIIAMLTLPHLDRPLTVALIAFVLDIPFLALVVIDAQQLADGIIRKSGDRADAVGMTWIRNFSTLPVPIGFCAILWHFGMFVFLTFVAGICGAFLLNFASLWWDKRTRRE